MPPSSRPGSSGWGTTETASTIHGRPCSDYEPVWNPVTTRETTTTILDCRFQWAVSSHLAPGNQASDDPLVKLPKEAYM